jgi:hypothetical protein
MLISDFKIYWTEHTQFIYDPCRKSEIDVKLL